MSLQEVVKRARRPLAAGDGSAESCVPEFGPAREPFALFTEGDDLYDAMLSTIRGARDEVLLESYLFAADEVGERFVSALAERAREGVDVRVLVDAVGSLGRLPRAAERRMSEAGVVLRRFHRWRWQTPLRYNHRDHRKLLVVDGATAFVGGFNIHRESSRRAFGEARWRDAHLRLDGELALQARGLFEAIWRGRHSTPPQATGSATVLLPNHTRVCRQRLGCLFDAILSEARQSLFLTTPYFVPGPRLRRGLRRAAQRGVDVRVLVPRAGDVPLARWAAAAVYGDLMRSGVRVFEYLPRMLHAKTLVADGDWAVIGTANVDYRSVFLNYELVVASRDPALCAVLRSQFEDELSDAEAVKSIKWAQRPWLARLTSRLAWTLRAWLECRDVPKALCL